MSPNCPLFDVGQKFYQSAIYFNDFENIYFFKSLSYFFLILTVSLHALSNVVFAAIINGFNEL